jgi:hypothetical protein
VGVNEPTSKLDVSGSVRIRENLLIDSLAFTPDQSNPASLRTLLVGPDGKISLSRSGITDTTQFPLIASVAVLDSASAKGIKGGEAAVTVSGGMPPYRIEWNNGEKGDTAYALKAGLQKVLVFDANGLKKELALEVPQIAPLNLTLASDTFPNGKNTSCYQCKDGVIIGSASGGRKPYTFNWLTDINASLSITGENNITQSALGAGLYILQITDATGENAIAWINLAAPERPDWSMVGNAQTDPQNQFIGTTDSTDVVFRTNNIEALRLAANENIGVGVNEPTAKLDVLGTVRVRENLLVDSLAFTPDTNAVGQFRVLMTDENGRIVTSRHRWDDSDRNPGGPTPIPCGPTPACGIGTLSTAWIKPLNSGYMGDACWKMDNVVATCSKVGINTASPQYWLDVRAGGYMHTLKIGHLANLGASVNGLEVEGNSQLNGSVVINSSSTEEPAVKLNATNTGMVTEVSSLDARAFVIRGPVPSNPHYTEPSAFAPAPDENNLRDNFVINGNGYVSIGVNDWKEESLLSVGGLISSRAFKIRPIDTELPDYVFYQDYQLPSLDSIKTYIEENCHLPGVPSVQQANEEGVDVLDMQNRQLEQIERLYLYVIELERRLKLAEETIRNSNNTTR